MWWKAGLRWVIAGTVAAWLGFGCAETPGELAAPDGGAAGATACPDAGADAARSVPGCANGVISPSNGTGTAPGAGAGSGA